MDAESAADALWDAADDAGTVWQVGLPKAVSDEMQAVVDGAWWVCRHVESAGDLPPALVPKLALAGGVGISCLQPACVLTMHDVSYARRLTACIFCRHKVPSYEPLFSDEASGLSMRAPVCVPCAAPGGPLADWAGVPLTRRHKPKVCTPALARPTRPSAAPERSRATHQPHT